jgi:hypothetical protein
VGRARDKQLISGVLKEPEANERAALHKRIRVCAGTPVPLPLTSRGTTHAQTAGKRWPGERRRQLISRAHLPCAKLSLPVCRDSRVPCRYPLLAVSLSLSHPSPVPLAPCSPRARVCTRTKPRAVVCVCTGTNAEHTGILYFWAFIVSHNTYAWLAHVHNGSTC